jgi:L-amino acid N-acyltransferase YncA
MRIRLAIPTDGDAIAAIYAPIVATTSISFETEAPDGTEMARRISATVPRFPWLIAEAGELVAGFAYAGPHRKRAAYRWATEVSVYVAAGERRRGVGCRLYAALLALLRTQGFHSAYAGITQPNPASVAFHESVGFTSVGVYRDAGWKGGEWRDVGWWQLPLGDGSPPGKLATLDEIAVEAILEPWSA